MSYKVQLKRHGSLYTQGHKFPYNQIIEVKKELFDYLKKTFSNDFNFFGEEPKKKVAEKKEPEKKVTARKRASRKAKTPEVEGAIEK